MSVFTYRALDERATTVEGTISADSPRAARDLLRGRGLVVEQVTQQAEAGNRRWWPFRRRHRHAARRIEMIRELSTLLAAGIPLLESLDSLVAQQQNNFTGRGFRDSHLHDFQHRQLVPPTNHGHRNLVVDSTLGRCSGRSRAWVDNDFPARNRERPLIDANLR